MSSRIAAVIYVAITCVVGRHVLASLASAIANDPGDPLLNAAILAWNATNMPWSDAWFQFPIFHPTRDALTLSEHLLGLSVIATPFYWATGSAAAAYNLTLLLTYPLSGMAMYALVWRMTRSSPAAFVAGLAFAFAPYRASQLPHIQMLAVFWAPLALFGLHRFADSAGHAPHIRDDAGGAPHARDGAVPASHTTEATRPARLHRRMADSTARGHLDLGPGAAGAAPAGGLREWRGRWRGLVLFAVCWALQGAANGYMLVYFSLFVGGWAAWFLAARRRWRETAWVAGAAAVASIPLLPILYRYLTAQRALGLSRNLGEISSYGADLGALACAPSTLAFWGWLRVGCAPEGELFPGIALAAFVVLAAAWRKRGNADRSVRGMSPGVSEPDRRRVDGPRLLGFAVRGPMIALASGLALLFLVIAASVWVGGPWRIDVGWFRASASAADKPLSTALALLLIAFLLSDRFRAAIARGSTATFYAGAAVVCWVLAWGPFPRLFGTPVLYQAPYAWLLQLPGFDALRVPARFWMLTVLCLSVCAGLVVARLLRDSSSRRGAVLTAAAAGALLLDGWLSIAAAPIPPPPAAAASLREAPVLVTPAGELFGDAGVVYHAVAGGWTAINGYSGYEPGYYEALRTLSQAGDDAQVAPFLRRGDLHVVARGSVRRLPSRASTPPPPQPAGQRLAARLVDASCETTESLFALDGDVDTRWLCGMQTADHHVTLDLGERRSVHAIVYALGSAGAGFPRHLVVDTSADGEAWDAAWEGSPAAAVIEAALAAPRETRVAIPFTPRGARYVRLRQTGRHDTTYWTIAELEVWSP